MLAVLLALAACGRNAPSPANTTDRPRLVVVVVIDQYPSWAFAQQKHLFTGGIGRMLREGAFVPNGELPYANTFTAPGHAAISTGAPPHVHGIVGNYWHRRTEGRDRPAEYDPLAMPHVVGVPLGDAKLTADDGASGRALRVEGVADVLERATAGAAKSVAVALKSRSACLVAGTQPDVAIWYEPAAGGMTTSTAYAREAPPWLVELAARAPASRYFGATWEPLDASLLARETKLADDAPGESSHHGLGAAFPHTLSAAAHPERALQQTPFADELVAHTVTNAIDALQLGRDDVPDLLAISFSAHDYAGHDWGPDSWEVLDVTLRLDRALGELFALLDTRLGPQGWAAIVTSDHGATPIVERGRVPGARRIAPNEIEDAARAALEAALPERKPWVAHQMSGSVYITPSLAELPADVRGRALDAVVTAVKAVPGVALVGRTDLFSAGCTAERDLMRAVCNASVPGDAGDLYVYPAPGSVITSHASGTGHDSPGDDTRHVPILVKAPGVRPQQGKGSLLQVAPTLAALLGIPAPPAAREPPLFGIQRR